MSPIDLIRAHIAAGVTVNGGLADSTWEGLKVYLIEAYGPIDGDTIRDELIEEKDLEERSQTFQKGKSKKY